MVSPFDNIESSIVERSDALANTRSRWKLRRGPTQAKPVEMPRLPTFPRNSLFDPVVKGLGESQAAEAVKEKPSTGPGTTTKAQPPAPKGDPAAGKRLFEANGCGGCHAFSAAGTLSLDP